MLKWSGLNCVQRRSTNSEMLGAKISLLQCLAMMWVETIDFVNICPEISAKLQGSFRFAFRPRISRELAVAEDFQENQNGRMVEICR